MKDGSVNTIVTSPPYYGLRDYGVDGQIGLEETPEEYVNKLIKVFKEAKRVLKDDGTLWLNLGDSYTGSGKVPAGNLGKTHDERNLENTCVSGNIPGGLKRKELIGIPWKVAFALQADGWYLRQDIIWNKTNPKPESVKDRCTKSHEYIFLFSKQPKYYYDNESIKEKAVTPPAVRDKNNEGYRADYANGDRFSKGERTYGVDGLRNKRDVWTVATKPFKGSHFATFPPDLILPCVLAGCPENGIVLDPFMGSGTTGIVSKQNNRNFIGIEINKDYLQMAKERIETA